MIRFVLRRAARALFLLIGVSLLSFALLQLAPGEFFSEMKLNPQISPETVAALRLQYGLDRPLPVRYARWIGSVARGDFGVSFAYGLPAAPLLLARAKNTLLLTFTATLLSWAIAVPLGVWSAARVRRWGDRTASGVSSVMLAVPELTFALLLLVLAARTGWFPVGGMASVNTADAASSGALHDLLRHMVLPVAVVVFGTVPLIFRHTRAALAEVMDAPFVRAAHAHGLSSKTVLYRYALRTAANPLISLFGFSVATLLSASLIAEIVLGWPGLGPLLLEAIVARDLYVVIGAVVLSTLLLVSGNLLADILLLISDPRISEGDA